MIGSGSLSKPLETTQSFFPLHLLIHPGEVRDGDAASQKPGGDVTNTPFPETLRHSDLKRKGRSSRNGEKGYAGEGE